MAVLIASDLRKDIAGAPLLRGVSLKLERRDRLTIAGRNGAGKTTLLRMLAGETSVDGGELVYSKGARVALHDQRPPRDTGLTLRDYVTAGAAHLVALEEQLARLEAQMAEGDTSERTLDAYGRAQGELEHHGGYAWRERALGTVHGLGFGDEQLDRSLETFSGGELTRASLARALVSEPDLLLLDEPTNHLDIESLEWLEQALISMDAAIVLVAHDRWFLEAVGTAVLEIEAGRSRFFPGTWSAWRREAAAREMALGKAIDKQRKEIERMERFVERFRYKATKARQAQDRLKKLNKIERIERDPRDERELAFSFKPVERSGRVVFELIDGEIAVPGRTLIRNAHLWLERAEHVSLVGPNGSGKTTLLHALVGDGALAGGELRRGYNTQVGYLSQHAESLGATGTVLEACQRATKLSPNQARALLGRFLFSGDEAEKPLAGLSGGERQRLSLAILVHSGANVLVLDEPTNHLDLDAREALEDALREYPGSLLLVSHDRALLDAVGTRTIAVEDGTLRTYEGGWPEYARVREERKELAQAPKAAKATNGASKPKSKPAVAAKAPSKNQQARAARLERQIEQAEAQLKALEEELADPSAWASPSATERNTARHDEAKRRVEELMARWEAVAT
jgi:ATP-binding cassette subfamily F protein 3